MWGGGIRLEGGRGGGDVDGLEDQVVKGAWVMSNGLVEVTMGFRG